MSAARYVVWFSEVGKEDIPLVGGKAANLGEMYGADFPVPNGFVITSRAYYFFIKENNLNKKIEHLLNTANFERPETLVGLSADIKKAIIEAEMSKDLITEIRDHYKKLGGLFSDALVAVRSSATAEDLPNASFAGQQETFLNVSGDSVLLHKCVVCRAARDLPKRIW